MSWTEPLAVVLGGLFLAFILVGAFWPTIVLGGALGALNVYLLGRELPDDE